MYSLSRVGCFLYPPFISNLTLNCPLDDVLVLFPLMLPDLFAPAVPWLACMRRLGVQVQVVLSAGEESVAFGHLVAVFAVCAEHPGHADDAAEGEAYDGRVGFPVGWLGVPTTSRRPDVLGVSAGRQFCTGTQLAVGSYGIFPPPPMVKVVVRVRGVCCLRSCREVAVAW